MKLMRSFGRLGANRSHSRSYGEDLQRRMADEGAISCKRFGETQYQCSTLASSVYFSAQNNKLVVFNRMVVTTFPRR